MKDLNKEWAVWCAQQEREQAHRSAFLAEVFFWFVALCLGWVWR